MARKGKRGFTRKLLRVPQGAVNTALGLVKNTGKGTVKIAKTAGKGAVGITRTAVGTTRNIGKTAVGTLGRVGIRTTKGLTKLLKNSLDLASNATTGILRGVSGRKRTHKRRH